ncbi:MAG: dihydroorotate dehydrogenase electron transfer subunit, partial [Bacteroides sp.]|nr:dihydroorotate dehydrogenase electron transfer subunit [Bacteroides sp.]
MKQIVDFQISSNRMFAGSFCEMKLHPADPRQRVSDVRPGQFVQVQVPDSPHTFLRRPISICDFDVSAQTLTLLIRCAGQGTAHLMAMNPGDRLNIILPLGNGFTTSLPSGSKALLIGGGVGVAPMHMLGKTLASRGVDVTFLSGARTAGALLMIEQLSRIGCVELTTDDGSAGVCGVVTAHPVISDLNSFGAVYCCGPSPMMKAVASIARAAGVECEVSLENMM